MSEPWLDPALREACRGQLARELILRLVIHDIRNPLTPILGALEMLEMGGTTVPDYLNRSVQRLGERLAVYSAFTWASPPEAAPVGPALKAVLGDIVTGGHYPLPVSPLRLVSALELAAPRAVTVAMDDVRGWRVSALGLSQEAIELGMAPRFEELAARAEAPDATLGAALLRAVAREAGGQIGRVGGDESSRGLVMLLPG